jgi:hypothetical protein
MLSNSAKRLNDAGFDASVFNRPRPESRPLHRRRTIKLRLRNDRQQIFDSLRVQASHSREVVHLGRAQSAVSARSDSCGPRYLTTRESFQFVTTIVLIAAASKCLQNPRGTLTVVNVLGLEDYVRGVRSE